MGVNMRNYVMYAVSEDFSNLPKVLQDKDICEYPMDKYGEIGIIDGGEGNDTYYIGIILAVSEDGRYDSIEFPQQLTFDLEENGLSALVDDINNELGTCYDFDNFYLHVFTRYS